MQCLLSLCSINVSWQIMVFPCQFEQQIVVFHQIGQEPAVFLAKCNISSETVNSVSNIQHGGALKIEFCLQIVVYNTFDGF